jgi:hypothetical protein
VGKGWGGGGSSLVGWAECNEAQRDNDRHGVCVGLRYAQPNLRHPTRQPPPGHACLAPPRVGGWGGSSRLVGRGRDPGRITAVQARCNALGTQHLQ